MRSGVALVMIGAAMLAGCTQYGRRGVSRLARYPAMQCAMLEAERGRVEQGVRGLRVRAERVAEPTGRATAEATGYWPNQLYLRGPGKRDRQRYQALAMSYDQLRHSARARGCALALAPDVSKAAAAR